MAELAVMEDELGPVPFWCTGVKGTQNHKMSDKSTDGFYWTPSQQSASEYAPEPSHRHCNGC